MRDFTELLGQQMFFWGRDVVHPQGNLLCKSGFEKRKSNGLQGTSCYRKELAHGEFIELHGACAGIYSPTSEGYSGFIYIRNKNRCFLYSGKEPPVPGIYEKDTLIGKSALKLYIASLRFLDWWLAYEAWVACQTSKSWRENNYTNFANLPASRASLPPDEATAWLSHYCDRPAKLIRLRQQKRELKRH